MRRARRRSVCCASVSWRSWCVGSLTLLIELAQRRAPRGVREEVCAVAEDVYAADGPAGGDAAHALVGDARKQSACEAVQPDDLEGAAEEVARLRGERLGQPERVVHLRDALVRSEERRVGKECRSRWSR